jgi:predicted membrane channel-forming protein YqfA (hemolysin III family)
MISQPLSSSSSSLKPSKNTSYDTKSLKTKNENEEKLQPIKESSQWMRAAMFIVAAVIILYIQSITRDQEKISQDDLGLVYTLYACSLLLLVGMSVLW